MLETEDGEFLILTGQKDGHQNLVLEYAAAKQSYNSVKNKRTLLEEKNEEDRVIDKNNLAIDQNISLELSIFSNCPLFPRRDTLNQKDIETQFIKAIKTSGLRFSRERNLVSLFEQLSSDHNDTMGLLQDTQEKCVEHNEQCALLVKNMINDCKVKMANAIHTSEVTKQDVSNLHAENIRLNEVLKSTMNEHTVVLKKQNLEKESVNNKNKETMEKFIKDMEIEIEDAKLELFEEAKRKARESFQKKENDKNQRIVGLENILEKMKSENMNNKDRIKFQEKSFESILDVKEASLQDSKREASSFHKKFEQAEQRIVFQANKIKKLEHCLDIKRTEVEAISLKVEKNKNERDQELSVINNRIKHLIVAKDTKIKELGDKLKKFENIISSLEIGFEEIPP